MNKILGLSMSGLIITVVVIVGSWAYFGDIQASAQDINSGDTLDLRLNGGDTNVHILNGLNNIAPGDSGNPFARLGNAGGLPGALDIQMSPISNLGTNRESGYAEGSGDLGNVLEIAPWIDLNGNELFDAGADIALKSDGSFTSSALEWNDINGFGGRIWQDIVPEMAGGSEYRFYFNWRLPEDAGNNIQGQNLDFGVGFTLKQIM
jgi:hypothetical protein